MEHITGEMPNQHSLWLAAANSEHGFENGFPALFGEDSGVKRLYVIKGGPGTGKSRLMKEVARRAESNGWLVARFLCSSDPQSLDGLWLISQAGYKVGFLDGTAPHAWEPTLPGAREDILNLGVFWDSAALAAERDNITRLNLRKSAAYRRAYRCLRAAGEADRVAESLLAPCVREARLDATADRLIRLAVRSTPPQAPDRGSLPAFAFRQGFSMTGRIRLDTPERLASQCVYVGDNTGVGYRLLHLLCLKAHERGLPLTVLRDPLRPDRADGVLFHGSCLCVLYDKCPAPSATNTSPAPRALSLRSCLDTDALRAVRPLLREVATLREDALRAADHHLAAAADAHFSLEQLYMAAMDFEAVTGFTEEVCRRAMP